MTHPVVTRPGPRAPRDQLPGVPLALGSRLGDYEISDLLGQGSFGVTYRARALGSGEEVAIKVFRPRLPEGLPLGSAVAPGLRARPEVKASACCRREAELLVGLKHANIIALRASHHDEDPPYLVMAFPEGTGLDKHLALSRQSIDQDQLLAILLPLLDALDHIHGRGFLHRDVKPANIRLAVDATPFLIDFGAARPIGENGAGLNETTGDETTSDETTSHATVGYAPPEQYSLEANEGPWSDIYALAAIAYRAIAGAAPPAALRRLKGETMIPALEVGRDTFTPQFLKAVDWALNEKPEERPQSIGEWRAALTATDSVSPENRVAITTRDQGEARPLANPKTSIAPRRGPGPEDDSPPTERVTRIALTLEKPKRPAKVIAKDPRGEVRPERQGRPWARLLALFLVLTLAGAGWGATQWYQWRFKTEWTVDPAGGADAVSIAEAIALAPAGATLRIMPGLYAESLVIAEPLNLIGLGSDEAPVLVAPTSGPCLVIESDGSSVRGVSFQGPAASGEASQPCLDLAAMGLVVADNRISNPAGPGLRLRDGAEATIIGNSINETGGAGILVDTGSQGTITGNQIEASAKAGLIIRAGAAPVVTANRILASGQAGILVTGGGSGRIEDNEILEAAASGIEVRRGADPLVTGNRITRARQAGIFVYDAGYGRFQNNIIEESGYSGVVIAAGAAPTLANNEIRNSAEHGILILEGGGGSVTANKIQDNKGHGIAKDQQVTTKLKDNELSGNLTPQIETGLVTTQ